MKPQKVVVWGRWNSPKFRFSGYFQVPAVSLRGGIYLKPSEFQNNKKNLAAHVDRVLGLQPQSYWKWLGNIKERPSFCFFLKDGPQPVINRVAVVHPYKWPKINV